MANGERRIDQEAFLKGEIDIATKEDGLVILKEKPSKNKLTKRPKTQKFKKTIEPEIVEKSGVDISDKMQELKDELGGILVEMNSNPSGKRIIQLKKKMDDLEKIIISLEEEKKKNNYWQDRAKSQKADIKESREMVMERRKAREDNQKSANNESEGASEDISAIPEAVPLDMDETNAIEILEKEKAEKKEHLEMLLNVQFKESLDRDPGRDNPEEIEIRTAIAEKIQNDRNRIYEIDAEIKKYTEGSDSKEKFNPKDYSGYWPGRSEVLKDAIDNSRSDVNQNLKSELELLEYAQVGLRDDEAVFSDGKFSQEEQNIISDKINKNQKRINEIKRILDPNFKPKENSTVTFIAKQEQEESVAKLKTRVPAEKPKVDSKEWNDLMAQRNAEKLEQKNFLDAKQAYSELDKSENIGIDYSEINKKERDEIEIKENIIKLKDKQAADIEKERMKYIKRALLEREKNMPDKIGDDLLEETAQKIKDEAMEEMMKKYPELSEMTEDGKKPLINLLEAQGKEIIELKETVKTEQLNTVEAITKAGELEGKLNSIDAATLELGSKLDKKELSKWKKIWKDPKFRILLIGTIYAGGALALGATGPASAPLYFGAKMLVAKAGGTLFLPYAGGSSTLIGAAVPAAMEASRWFLKKIGVVKSENDVEKATKEYMVKIEEIKNSANGQQVNETRPEGQSQNGEALGVNIAEKLTDSKNEELDVAKIVEFVKESKENNLTAQELFNGFRGKIENIESAMEAIKPEMKIIAIFQKDRDINAAHKWLREKLAEIKEQKLVYQENIEQKKPEISVEPVKGKEKEIADGKKEKEKTVEVEKPIDFFGDLENKDNIDEVITEKGSVYKYLPDGRTQRYKKVEDKNHESQDALVYIPNFEWMKKNASKENLEKIVGEYNSSSGFEQELLHYVHDSGKVVQISGISGEPLNTNHEIAAYKNQIFLNFGENGKTHFSIPVSRKPKVGFNTFDTRTYKKDGNIWTEKHIGNKVATIKLKQKQLSIK